MKERPILFSAPMVRAILEGRKTQTRRVVKPQPHRVYDIAGATFDASDGVWAWHDSTEKICNLRRFACPHGKPGDRLWVKEKLVARNSAYGLGVSYESDGTFCLTGPGSVDVVNPRPGVVAHIECAKWPWIERTSMPSIYMPRWASRLTLEITGVRVERLRDITLPECAEEGAPPTHPADNVWDSSKTFRKLWDSINGKTHPWASNPWVWVIKFKRVGGGA